MIITTIARIVAHLFEGKSDCDFIICAVVSDVRHSASVAVVSDNFGDFAFALDTVSNFLTAHAKSLYLLFLYNARIIPMVAIKALLAAFSRKSVA